MIPPVGVSFGGLALAGTVGIGDEDLVEDIPNW